MAGREREEHPTGASRLGRRPLGASPRLQGRNPSRGCSQRQHDGHRFRHQQLPRHRLRRWGRRAVSEERAETRQTLLHPRGVRPVTPRAPLPSETLASERHLLHSIAKHIVEQYIAHELGRIAIGDLS